MKNSILKHHSACFIMLSASAILLSSCGESPSSTNERDVGFHTKAPESVKVELQGLQNYNGKDATHLLANRSKVVQQNANLLKTPYVPTPSVFQIDTKSSWWSNKGYFFRSVNATEGVSRESAYFGNPLILVCPEFYASSPVFAPTRFPNEATAANVFPSYLPPASVVITPKEKQEEIVYNVMSHYNMIKSMMKGPWPISKMSFNLNAYNARDFGFNYIYVDASKSENLQKCSSDVIPITQAITVRTRQSCAASCNDINEQDTLKGFALKDLPAKCHVLLWKEKPSSYVAPADMKVDIIFTAK